MGSPWLGRSGEGGGDGDDALNHVPADREVFESKPQIKEAATVGAGCCLLQSEASSQAAATPNR